MSVQTVRYQSESPKRSLGRNGYLRTTGAQVMGGGAYVTIAPLDSKGRPGRCEITVPQADVAAVAAALLRSIGR